MDPARPNEPEPSDPFNPDHADRAVLETIEIATEAKIAINAYEIAPVLMKMNACVMSLSDLPRERVIVTFDARKTLRARSARRDSEERLQAETPSGLNVVSGGL